jgi:hypothetical protein
MTLVTVIREALEGLVQARALRVVIAAWRQDPAGAIGEIGEHFDRQAEPGLARLMSIMKGLLEECARTAGPPPGEALAREQPIATLDDLAAALAEHPHGGLDALPAVLDELAAVTMAGGALWLIVKAGGRWHRSLRPASV